MKTEEEKEARVERQGNIFLTCKFGMQSHVWTGNEIDAQVNQDGPGKIGQVSRCVDRDGQIDRDRDQDRRTDRCSFLTR